MEDVAPRVGKVRWKRFAALMVPAGAAAVVLVGLTASGSIAASFAVSGQSFKVSADQLQGRGFAQYGQVDETANGVKHPVAISVVGAAKLKNLCQSVLINSPMGKLTLLVKAGGGDTPASADNMVVDASQLSGDATFKNIEIGRDAGTIDKVQKRGPSGMFAQQADTVTIDDLHQTAWAVNAGTFRLNGLNLTIKPGSHECF
jgi:hypothetical protein